MAHFIPEGSKDSKLLTEIRENFSYAVDALREIRLEAQTDMRFISGDGWDPKERAARDDPKQPRPCLDNDELSQYVNQLINDVRESPRSIKVIPTGSGSNDKTADLRADKIRNIEYDSAAQAAYVTAFEGAVQRGYGAARVNTAPNSDSPFDDNKKIVIRRIANPDSVYPDPDFREADGSDMRWCFVVDWMSREKFKDKYPKAKYADFAAEMGSSKPHWAAERGIQIAEYWKVESANQTACKLADGRVMDAADVPEGAIVVAKKEYTKQQAVQYITNGFEILEEKVSFPCKYIPIVLCIGRELWIDSGGQSKRVWESLIRHARSPQQLYNYYRTTQAEVVRMVPKSPFVGARGQFEGHEKDWQQVNNKPLAYLEYEAFVADTAGNPQQQLPPPARPAYDPPVQQLEAGAQAARMAIQAAMGIMPLPTQAQRQNEKSGVALEHIKDETQKGSYHFIDNYERFLMHVGRIINELLPKVYDTPRDVVVTRQDGKHEIVHINEADPRQAAQGQAAILAFGDGEHDVTISTGPSYQSERDKADQFVTNLFPTIAAMPIADAAKAQLTALAIRLQDLGPLGDQMAKVIFPDEQAQIPPQAQAALQQLQQRLQLADLTVAQLQQEKVSEFAKLQNDLAIARENNETKIAIAEITTKAQILQERLNTLTEAQQAMHDAAHDVGLSELEHAQTLQQGQQAAEQAAQQQQAQQQQTTPSA